MNDISHHVFSQPYATPGVFLRHYHQHKGTCRIQQKSSNTKHRLHHVAAAREETNEIRKVALVALGGNALLQRGEDPTAENQAKHAREAATALAALVQEEGYSLCVTHGNGPQIGLLALKAPKEHLDVLGVRGADWVCARH